MPAGKVAVGARFAITGVQSAPSSIRVTLSTGEVRTVAVSAQVGESAYYNLTLTAGTRITAAAAVVPCHWTGAFELVSYQYTGTGTGAGGSASGGTGSTGSHSGGTGSTGSHSGGTGSTGSHSGGTGSTESHSTETGSTESGAHAAGSAATGSVAHSTTQVAGARAVRVHAAGSAPTGSVSGERHASGGGFPVGETGKVATPAGEPSWPLIGLGLAGLLAAALLFVRSAHGTSER